MKDRILTLFVLAGILYSCGEKAKDQKHQKEEPKKDYVVLEGHIKTDGNETEDIYLLVDPLVIENNIVKKIFLDKEGNFKDSIQNIKEGYYILMNSDNKAVNLYLKNDDVIHVKTNALSNESFLDSLSVEGNIESVFLTDYEKFKQSNFDSNIQELFSLDEEPFKAKLDSLKHRSTKYVEEYKGLSQEAKKVAKEDILYGWGLVLNSYPMAHAQIKQDRNYRPSESYYDFSKAIDINNPTLFKNNAKYRNYVAQELNRRIAKGYKPTQGEDQIDYFVKKLNQDSIVPYIKDFMLIQLANQGIFQPAPTYEQYQQNVLQSVQAQIQAFKKQNPQAQIPASATPTKEQIQKEYNKYVEEYNKFYDKSYNKVITNVETPEFKRILEENNRIIKGLKKGDVAPAIEIIKDGKSTDLVGLNKGKNLLVYFWTTSSENTTDFFDDYNKLADEFLNKNIIFATVNIDFLNKKEKWNLTLKEKQIKGEHYFATDDWDTGFIKSYGFNIRPFPRFVLINGEGNIIDFDAPTPKDPKLKKILSELINAK
ncbi:MAG: TlpA family protein disulfide reductase [Flavobacteriales bacterium]